MKEIGDIAYLLVTAERKRIRENSTEIIIINAAVNEFPERDPSRCRDDN
jgi:hypothetical protein